MKKTFTPSEKELVAKWHLIDADGKILGKLASEIAVLLTGKNKAIFTPNINTGDKVVVINAEKVAFSGNKRKDKMYYWLTGFPGGLKSARLEELLEKKPTEVLRKAVTGMLPMNKLKKVRVANLYIYKGDKHPHQGQVGN